MSWCFWLFSPIFDVFRVPIDTCRHGVDARAKIELEAVTQRSGLDERPFGGPGGLDDIFPWTAGESRKTVWNIWLPAETGRWTAIWLTRRVLRRAHSLMSRCSSRPVVWWWWFSYGNRGKLIRQYELDMKGWENDGIKAPCRMWKMMGVSGITISIWRGKMQRNSGHRTLGHWTFAASCCKAKCATQHPRGWLLTPKSRGLWPSPNICVNFFGFQHSWTSLSCLGCLKNCRWRRPQVKLAARDGAPAPRPCGPFGRSIKWSGARFGWSKCGKGQRALDLFHDFFWSLFMNHMNHWILLELLHSLVRLKP